MKMQFLAPDKNLSIFSDVNRSKTDVDLTLKLNEVSIAQYQIYYWLIIEMDIHILDVDQLQIANKLLYLIGFMTWDKVQ